MLPDDTYEMVTQQLKLKCKQQKDLQTIVTGSVKTRHNHTSHAIKFSLLILPL